MSPRPSRTAPARIFRAALLLPALLGGCDALYDDTKGWANRLEASLLKLGEDAEPAPQPAPEAPPALAALPAPPAVPVEPVAVVSLPEAAAPAAPQPQSAPPAAEAPAPARTPEGVLADASAVLLAPAAAPEVGVEAKPETETKIEAKAEVEPKAESKTDKQTTASPPVPKAKPAAPEGAAEPAPADAAVAAVLHLSSLRSEEAAKRQWSDLQRSFPEPLGGLQAQFTRTELGEKGTFYRVLAGPLPSRDAASEVCAALKAKDSRQYCRVVTAAPQS